MNSPKTDAKIFQVLRHRFGHDRFLPMQEEVITSVLAGRDSLVLMPTGSGKSVCYQLPALLLDGLTLVVSPLIALMKDQVDALTSKGVRAAFINSTMTHSAIRSVQLDAYHGHLEILYVAPERLVTPRFSEFLKAAKPSLIAIDEAHCISEWGHDFRPDYRNLQALRDEFPDTPMIALTATATEKVREDIIHQLKMTEVTRFVASFNRPNLIYRVRPKRRSFELLIDVLQRHGNASAIVYRFSRKETEELATRLSSRGFKALPYHAGLEDEVRRETQERFLNDEVPIIVATIAFGMGVDKPNVRLVVHYDLPKTIEGYYQETGRAGRDGEPSECVLFFSFRDKIKQDFFIDQIEDETERANAKAKLAKMVEYGSGKACRREFLLNYFGEAWWQKNCGACDTCLGGERGIQSGSTYDGTVVAQKVLSCVRRTGERFGANHIVDVLRGSRSSRVLKFGHDELSVHGIARQMPKGDMLDVVDQLLDMGLLERGSGEFPTLAVTSGGREFLENPTAITLLRGDGSPSPPDDRFTDYDAVLFEKLRVLRKDLADGLSVPAFVVFHDATLRELASRMPTDRNSLLKVKGVGESKVQQFGDRFISVIADHLTGTGGQVAVVPPLAETNSASQDGSLEHSQAGSGRVPMPAEKLLSAVVGYSVTMVQGDATSLAALHIELGRALGALRERESDVLIRRFGVDGGRGHARKDIGASLNISEDLVRQIEEEALRKLRHSSRLGRLTALAMHNAKPGNGSSLSEAETDHPESKTRSYMDEARESHPRAYEPWSADEEGQLHSLYESGRSIEEIASRLERRPSAIRSRLRRILPIQQDGQPHALTLEQVRAGLDVAQIAQRRGIREETVIAHLERLADEGLAPDLTYLMPESDRYERIVQAFKEINGESLRPVKGSLGDDYSYEELRLVRMHMRKSSQGSVNPPA